MSAPRSGVEAAGAGRIVVFRLEGREFALPLDSVAEVQRMVAITPVPEAPAWLAGVISLRGQMVPVMDLRTRLGLPQQAAALDTRIIVTQAGGRLVGLVADRVEEVLALPDCSVEVPDDLAGGEHAISGVARPSDRLILVLDLDRLSHGSASFVPPSDVSQLG